MLGNSPEITFSNLLCWTLGCINIKHLKNVILVSVRGTKRFYRDHETLSVEGGGSIICYQDLQAAAGGGGRLGDDQGAVGSHHFLSAHVSADRGGIRDTQETEPASRFDRVQTLVKLERKLE